MPTATVVGAQELSIKFASMPGKLHKALLKTMFKVSSDLEYYVKTQKLEGQVLNHITGRLQGSIHSTAKDGQDRIEGRVYSAGCNYAAVHEYGFVGIVTVKEHVRTSVFGRSVPAFTVPAFSRSMNMPMRSFLRSSLADNDNKILDEFSEAVAGATR